MLKKYIAILMLAVVILSGCVKVEDTYIDPPSSAAVSTASEEDVSKPVNRPDNVVGDITEPAQPVEEETLPTEPKDIQSGSTACKEKRRGGLRFFIRL